MNILADLAVKATFAYPEVTAFTPKVLANFTHGCAKQLLQNCENKKTTLLTQGCQSAPWARVSEHLRCIKSDSN
jgi:hypothetical protein